MDLVSKIAGEILANALTNMLWQAVVTECSYALDLGLPDAQRYFRDLRLTQEPLRWLKARVKFDPFGSLGGLVLYAIRLVYNVAAQAFFPVLLTGG